MGQKILVIGSGGQIGMELIQKLRIMHGTDHVIASDIRSSDSSNGPFEVLDVMDKSRLHEIVDKHGIDQIYLLAALLSATAEKNPVYAWKLNMESLFHVLELGREKKISRIFWPSSIAVFGPETPRNHTPQHTVTDPSTVYGISKLAGERWCEYYHSKYGVDVRSIRYPGLISYSSPPGGGTTDYAVHVFWEALKNMQYECFLASDTVLPMMYMEDAIRATMELMEAPASQVRIRSSYNVAGFSFSPAEIAAEIQKHLPSFAIRYAPDFRQQIAATWPQSIDDHAARSDWGWKPRYSLEEMTADMLKNVERLLSPSITH
jgi:nucleoside-diphosphate-sugar epimerase